jgi:hypothetical protein
VLHYRGWLIIFWIIINFNESQVRALDQVRAILDRTHALTLRRRLTQTNAAAGLPPFFSAFAIVCSSAPIGGCCYVISAVSALSVGLTSPDRYDAGWSDTSTEAREGLQPMPLPNAIRMRICARSRRSSMSTVGFLKRACA